MREAVYGTGTAGESRVNRHISTKEGKLNMSMHLEQIGEIISSIEGFDFVFLVLLFVLKALTF